MVIELKYFFKGYVGFAVYPFIFIKKGRATDVVINHEKIHLRQQKELLIIVFFIAYALNYLVNLFIYKNSDKAYRNISFEREAYQNEKNLNYLK